MVTDNEQHLRIPCGDYWMDCPYKVEPLPESLRGKKEKVNA